MLWILCLCISILSGCSYEKRAQIKDGTYEASVTLEGGTGRATVQSPARITVKDGSIMATIVWSSSYYDYMIVEDEKYLNESSEGNSSFTIPVSAFDTEISVIADTTAMSTPHEIEYTLYFELEE